MAKATTPPPSYEAVSAAPPHPPHPPQHPHPPPPPISVATPGLSNRRPASSPSSPTSARSWPSSSNPWSSPTKSWSSSSCPPPPAPVLRRNVSSSSLSSGRPSELTPLTTNGPLTSTSFSSTARMRSASLSVARTEKPPIPSMLQPRVAVVLNVPQPWHPWLFALRLCSILPALWWGLPSLLRLLLHFLPGPPDQFMLVKQIAISGSNMDALQTSLLSSCSPEEGKAAAAAAAAVLAAPYPITETALATIWCFACGYLAFFFTDCLMSRWLINYTPHATLVRLLSINAVNAYLTLTVLSLTGGFQDPRLLLPGWVSIATSLTICYHVTHSKINIRKETITSVNVFSIASYITMVVLLAHMQWYKPDYPTMPIVSKGSRLWQNGKRLLANVKALINEHAQQ
ncbi:N-glycosylation domain-containing protein [Trichoderma sp. SZMC 28012]